MEFEYTAEIYICPQDLEQMYKYVKNGGDFANIFEDIMSGYDDCEYYNCSYIYEDVKAEIYRRLNQRKENKMTRHMEFTINFDLTCWGETEDFETDSIDSLQESLADYIMHSPEEFIPKMEDVKIWYEED